ncbi:hypothetical protein BX616_008199 [Lobosporangium transversale]|uniref:Uncharacterized protein n=1 Tax=Lobosporangium transversale TaxID=64571 RepID=A0A1Y2GZK8_9FUNG|nr:hypothetical protein BCR41DRAFT_392163 [Lobosporangium transversale]KAF9914480.1 hypothetical protein BX616_008199 [Lobosporangium transversale]ORZ27706.1 hypothetical protein BCR41DRAFT_392163 [Lobosporangium transversale]|eukprot:XP_021885409.1 hypothetical protein BCR41DRAFT_392163 [Lobosporangium transversale]
MRAQFHMFKSVASLALAGAVGLMSMAPLSAKADLICRKFGPDTFRVNATLKFYWSNTKIPVLESFKMNLYCVQNHKVVQTITTFNTNSTPPVYWTVDSTMPGHSAVCPHNQYQVAFDWPYYDSTGAVAYGSARCKLMLFIPSNQAPRPGSSISGPPADSEAQIAADDPPPGEIVVTEKTKMILIGVGSAVGALVLAGFVGFYVIRFSNKRAEKKSTARKLKEPAAATRYNDLASIATSSPVMTARGGRGAGGPTMTKSNYAHAPDKGPHPPTPIANANSNNSLTQDSASSTHRPASLLTSSFTPAEERNPYKKRENQQNH